jgi:membrane protease YdiL (CAAX protease family)
MMRDMNPMIEHSTSSIKTTHISDLWIGIAICFLIQIVGVQLLLPHYQKLFPSLPWILISFILTTLAFVIPFFYLAMIYGWPTSIDFKLTGRDLIILFISSLVLFIVASVYILNYGVRVSPDFSQLIENLDTFEYVPVILVIIIFVPFFEEIFFRRYVLQLFRCRYRLPIAILLTVGLETFLHIGYSIEQLVIICIFSLGLSIAYLKSRLATVVIIHCLINILFSFP